MKAILLPLAFLFSVATFAQSVGIGTTTPAATALLDVSSTTKGMLVPRMTSAQRAAISNPAQGLLIYQTDGVSGFYVNRSSGLFANWSLITEGTNLWSTSLGNSTSIYSNNTGNVGIGTTLPELKFSVTNDDSAIALFNNAQPLANNIQSNIYLSNGRNGFGGYFTGALKTIGTSSTTARMGLFTGAAAAGSNLAERMSIDNNGYVGIGTTAPNYLLDVNGRMRLRDNGTNATAGIWHNKANNLEAAFIGMVNDTTYGFFGNGNWRMGFDVKNAQMGIGTTDPSAPLSFPSSVGNKISLWGDAAGGHYGLGIQGSLLQMYSSANNADIAFGYGSSTAFTENMRIKGSGNVGIGTNNPTTKFEVKTDGFGFTHTGTTAAVQLGSFIDPSGGWFGTNTNHPLFFYANNSTSPQLTLLQNGRFGIGNTNPTSPLSFETSLGKKIALYPGGTGDAGFGVFGNELRINSDNANADVTFGYDNFSSGFTERMRVKGNGNVGIGTNAPSNKLDVNGRLRLRNESAGTTAGLWIDGPTTAQRGFVGAMDNNYMGFYGSGNGWGLLYNETSGQVNIGTATPATGYLLNVNGKIISEEVRVQLKAAWPDYVFNEGYKKLTIPQLETYLKENKHLPNIPSAEEIEKDGQHLGEIQRKMLEKIEELSLYVIELKKEIDVLNKKANN